MLRQVLNGHIKPRLVPFQLTTTTAPAASVDIGYGDLTVSRTSAGLAAPLLREPYSRNGMLFNSNSSLAGGYASLGTSAASGSLFSTLVSTNAGVATDGTCEGLFLGWDSTDLSFCKVQRVAATNEAPRVIWGKITGATGAVAIGLSDFACTRTATGTYSITFKKAFGKIPCVKITTLDPSTVVSEYIVSKTASGCVVRIGGTGGANTDPAAFYICAVGSDSLSDSEKGRLPLLNSQRMPRIVAVQISNTGGTYSISIGGATGGTSVTSLTKVGAGNFTMVLSTPFVREPAVFVSTTSQRSQLLSFTQSTSTINVNLASAGGTATDVNGITNVVVIGSRALGEY